MTRRPLAVSSASVLVVVSAFLITSCREARFVAHVTARALDERPAQVVAPTPVAQAAPFDPLRIPPDEASTFDFRSDGTAENGDLLYHVRIKAGGNPATVALAKLTPLFEIDGESAPEYVTDAFFRANPERNARSIQPGDEFELELPPDTFVVRSTIEATETYGGTAIVRTYVSERGDVLRYYLTEPFPIRYETMRAGDPGNWVVRFDPDLAYLLTRGLTDPRRLAQAVYRVADPDVFQTERIRSLIADVAPHAELTLEVDRTHTYLDPVREVLSRASAVVPVTENDREDLTRYVFTPDSGSPFAAVEDALGTRSHITELPDGRVFRIQYGWDGVVRVFYRTGRDDARGMRDPYALQENERWAALYAAIGASTDSPVKWGPGIPSDLPPFPSARDPANGDEGSFDFLIPGRTLVLTFEPTRFQSDVRAESELRSGLREMQQELRGPIEQGSAIINWLTGRSRSGSDQPRQIVERAPAEGG
ncbi:MAG TPA: hypothetical protein VFC51_19375 [Chloroflexota bacterium]|nr:hypothetical protein [Chloroflexota bacterium]